MKKLFAILAVMGVLSFGLVWNDSDSYGSGRSSSCNGTSSSNR